MLNVHGIYGILGGVKITWDALEMNEMYKCIIEQPRRKKRENYGTALGRTL